uniref:Reverse transcriptase domain-containing protein n=1 Tax=Rhizophagus irregularis (strain DAOM 181602 / DAOM 197198 / MUCL 43194) TaxID=747089 RepID=U9SY41_RHIID
MDISKVYDSVSSIMLEKNLGRLKLPTKLINISYCKQRSYDVRDGLDQGEIWSPILWRIFYDVSLTRLELVRNEVCYRIEVRYKDDVRSSDEKK